MFSGIGIGFSRPKTHPEIVSGVLFIRANKTNQEIRLASLEGARQDLEVQERDCPDKQRHSERGDRALEQDPENNTKIGT